MQEQYNANEPVVDPNPTIISNFNNRNQSLSSNLIFNENESFLPEQLTENDMKVNVNTKPDNSNNNNSESYLSDQSKDAEIKVKTKEESKKKRRQKKRKYNSKNDISDSNTPRSEHVKIEIPHEADSCDQKLNSDEYSTLDVEHNGTRDQEYHGIEILSLASDTSPCIM